jgi:hypothetical protein
MLAEGMPDDIRHDPRVIAAYLGTEPNGGGQPRPGHQQEAPPS